MARVPGAKPPPLAELTARARALGYRIDNRTIRARIEGSATPVLAVEIQLEPETPEAVTRLALLADQPRAILGRCPIDTSPSAPQHAQEIAANDAAARALDAALQTHHDQFGGPTP